MDGMNRVPVLRPILLKSWWPLSPAVLGIKLSLFANFFSLPIVLLFSHYNPPILCVWFGVRTPRHQPLPTHWDAQTPVGSRQLLPNQQQPAKAHECRGKATMLLAASPESPSAILPMGIKSPSGSRSPLNRLFPNTQPGDSRSSPAAAQGRGQGGAAWLGRVACL